MEFDLLIDRLKKWNSNLIGITINCQDKVDDVINIFKSISAILGIAK